VIGESAQSARAKQASQALVLSKDARINTTSQFENSAKDVHYTHRATTRRIDEVAALYRSRGLPAAEARRSAILTFARKMLNHIPLQQLAHRLEPLVVKELDLMLAGLFPPTGVS